MIWLWINCIQTKVEEKHERPNMREIGNSAIILGGILSENYENWLVTIRLIKWTFLILFMCVQIFTRVWVEWFYATSLKCWLFLVAQVICSVFLKWKIELT